MKPWKATRTGTVPNSIFIHAWELLVPHLGPIFHATDSLEVYPSDWKVTETPVLKKPGKPDYTVPNVWQPIILSNGYVRLLNGCKTEDLVLMCKKTGILPPNHFGGRPGRVGTLDGENSEGCMEDGGSSLVAVFGCEGSVPKYSGGCDET